MSTNNKRDSKRLRVNDKVDAVSSFHTNPVLCSIPTIHPDPITGKINYHEFITAFDEYQAVYIPKVVTNPRSTTTVTAYKNKISTWHDIQKLFMTSITPKDKESWCLESTIADDNNDINNKEDQDTFFRPIGPGSSSVCRIAYCSFLVQHDKEVVQDTLQKLPFADFDFETTSSSSINVNHLKQIQYGPCIWFFFGWNYSHKDDTTIATSDKKLLQGRPEHTDSVSHDATWHYQFSGSKIWQIRPTKELLARAATIPPGEKKINNAHDALLCHWPLLKELKIENNKNRIETSNGGIPVTIHCSQGDVLIINTRLWWHQTFIPLTNYEEPSISYARDGHFCARNNVDISSDATTKETNNGDSSSFHDDKNEAAPVISTNLDGLFATDDIEEDTVIFTENDMPDGEMHRSSSPNCQVTQLEDGTHCVVSLKPIRAGDFFCVAHSSSDDDDDDEEEEEDSDSVTSSTSTNSE